MDEHTPPIQTTVDGEPFTLSDLVFAALGRASVAWSQRPSGEFDYDRVKEVGDELVHTIQMQVIEALEHPGLYLAPDRLPMATPDIRSCSEAPQPYQVEVCSVCGLSWIKHLYLAKSLHTSRRAQAMSERQAELGGRPLKPEDIEDLPSWQEVSISSLVDMSICVQLQGRALVTRAWED